MFEYHGLLCRVTTTGTTEAGSALAAGVLPLRVQTPLGNVLCSWMYKHGLKACISQEQGKWLDRALGSRGAIWT